MTFGKTKEGNYCCQSPKPLAPSVYVHVPEAPSPHERSISATSLFPSCEEKGLHWILYRFSPEDYRQIAQIWTGTHPEDGSPSRVVDGPPEGGPVPDLEPEPQLTAPTGDVDPGFLQEVARRLFG